MRTFITFVCVSHFFVFHLLKIPKDVNVLQYHRSRFLFKNTRGSYIFYVTLVPTVKLVNGNQKTLERSTKMA